MTATSNLHAILAGINSNLHESPASYLIGAGAILVVVFFIGYAVTPASVKGKHAVDLANKDLALKAEQERHEADLAEKDQQIANEQAIVRRHENVSAYMFKVAGWIHNVDPAVYATGIDLRGSTTDDGMLGLTLQDPDQPAVYLHLTFTGFRSGREIDQKVTLTIDFVDGTQELDGRSLDLELRFNDSHSHPGMGRGYYHDFTEGGKIKLQDMLGRARILRNSGADDPALDTNDQPVIMGPEA